MPRRFLLPCLAIGLLTGCAGTRISRSDQTDPCVDPRPGSTFGGYPFQAVVVDWRVEERSSGEGDPVLAIGSLAVDAVVDLVLAPVDLVAWACGYHKRAMKP